MLVFTVLHDINKSLEPLNNALLLKRLQKERSIFARKYICL